MKQYIIRTISFLCWVYINQNKMTNYLRKIGKSGKGMNRRTYMNSTCTPKCPIILIIGLKNMAQ